METTLNLPSSGQGSGAPLPVSDKSSGREPSASELAALGIHTDPVAQSASEAAQAPVQPTQPETPDPDFIGKVLKPGRKPREFEGLDEEETKLFQSMSLPAYEKLYPLYKSTKGKDLSKLADLDKLTAELETLKKAQRPTSAFDHEEGYLLDRSYRQALVEQRTLNDVVTFYTKQLAAIRGGNKYHRLTQDGQGNIVVDPNPIDPSPAADAELTAALSQTQAAILQHQQKLESLKSGFGQEYKTLQSQISQVHNAIFGPHKEFLEPLAAKEILQFPESVRHRQEYVTLSYAMAVLRHLAMQYQAEQRTTAANNANAAVAKAVGPTARSITPTPAPNGANAKTSAEDYAKVRFQFGF